MSIQGSSNKQPVSIIGNDPKIPLDIDLGLFSIRKKSIEEQHRKFLEKYGIPDPGLSQVEKETEIIYERCITSLKRNDAMRKIASEYLTELKKQWIPFVGPMVSGFWDLVYWIGKGCGKA